MREVYNVWLTQLNPAWESVLGSSALVTVVAIIAAQGNACAPAGTGVFGGLELDEEWAPGACIIRSRSFDAGDAFDDR